jgi:hypothetical protein
MIGRVVEMGRRDCVGSIGHLICGLLAIPTTLIVSVLLVVALVLGRRPFNSYKSRPGISPRFISGRRWPIGAMMDDIID